MIHGIQIIIIQAVGGSVFTVCPYYHLCYYCIQGGRVVDLGIYYIIYLASYNPLVSIAFSLLPQSRFSGLSL